MIPTLPVAVGESAFDTASRQVLDYLRAHVPLDFWTVSRVIDGRQVYLRVTPNELGLDVGDGPRWEDSLCQLMVESNAPRVAPDVSVVPAYADRSDRLTMPVGAYIGFPLRAPDGSLFGTVCGVGTTPQDAEIAEFTPLLEMLSEVLSTVLSLDAHTFSLSRELESSRLDAETDALTGLLNRRAWQAACAIEESRHHLLGDHASIIMMDLDGLKPLNDQRGHAAGDELLRHAAGVLKKSSRTSDVVARLGGDEFAVLCPQATATAATALLERLRSELEDAGVRASLGVATMDQLSTMAETEALADQAMYDDKRRRRGPGVRDR